ncbi:MAG: tRNA (adenosine(37)-N6)-threonylcarbamoyltransferase complex ATPase subunit type 1 TsaE [Acidimicrobiales bacterium]
MKTPDLTARTSSAEDTRKLAAAVAELARPGDVVLLAGDLGAGKTAFTQGFGRGLGIDDLITSPTFVLARHYQGRYPLHHIDVYRLDQVDEIFDIGLPEMLDERAVVVIEWGDAIAPALPADYLEVLLTFGEGDDERVLAFGAVGWRWRGRDVALQLALIPWTEAGGVGAGPEPE